jgi:hypothetical protein
VRAIIATVQNPPLPKNRIKILGVKEKRSQRFQPTPAMRWMVSAIMILLSAALFITLVLVLYLLVQ